MEIFNDSQIRWTYRLIRVFELLLLAVAGYCLWRFIQSLNPYLSNLLGFVGISALVLIFILASVEKSLQHHKNYGWNIAILTSILAFFSPLLPLSVLSLRELLNSKNRSSFYKYKTTYSEDNMPRSTKMLISLLVMIGIFGSYWFYQHQQGSNYFDVAFIEPQYNLPPNQSIKELYAIGADCNTYGKTECSIAAFLAILQRRPGDKTALANLAMAQSHFGQHTYAISNFRKALNEGYESYDVFLIYGNSLKAKGHLNKAIISYKRAIDINPKLIDAAARITLILINQKKFSEALRFIESYLKKNPSAKRRLRSVREKLREKANEV